MSFDNSNEITSEVMALATVCGQTCMGENGGAVVFAYSPAGDLGSPRPGEAGVRFTLFDGHMGLVGELATQKMVSKVLTSGQVFDGIGNINPNLKQEIDTAALEQIDPMNISDCSLGAVRAINESLASTMATSDEWAAGFAERARIMRDMAQDTDTVFIHQTVQKLKGLMNIVRNANNQKTMDNIKENVLEK